MKADSIHLFDFLENGKTIFEIPVYQRNYEWGEQQCKQLFKDLLIATEDDQDHFIGAVVYVSDSGRKQSHIYRIIDGQQRLTSLTLLLKALADVDEEDRAEIQEQYLTNKYLEENSHWKLKPVEHDIEAFGAVMADRADRVDLPSKVIENYNTFKKLIKDAPFPSEELYEALNHFTMVYIELTNNVQDENPQVIFESLNSTGVSLSASDLVRNFLLMKLDSSSQARLYKEYWVKMEKIFTTNTFAEFIRRYLVMKTHKTVYNKRIYSVYKDYYNDSQLDSEAALDDLHRFAVFYQQLLQAKTGILELDRSLSHINIMDIKVVYPYFLMLLDMLDLGEISQEEVIELVKVMESYLFRSKFCFAKTAGLNRIVSSLCYKEKAAGDFLQREVSLLNTNFPTDKQMADRLMEVDLYSQRNHLAKLALMSIEESQTKEVIDFEDAQVEHVMPQELNSDWRLEVNNADKVNETYGGVIGNLTLTKYNQKMGNKSYGEKRKVYLDSNIKITRDLGMAYDKWDRESIINRTNELTKELIALFPKPVVKDSRKEELTGEFSITDSLDMTGKNPTRITIGDEDFSVDTWKKMLLTFMEELWQSDSRNYEKIKGDSSLNKMLFESLRRPERLRNGISIETNFSANMILAIIAKVSEICDIADEVSYTVK